MTVSVGEPGLAAGWINRSTAEQPIKRNMAAVRNRNLGMEFFDKPFIIFLFFLRGGSYFSVVGNISLSTKNQQERCQSSPDANLLKSHDFADIYSLSGYKKVRKHFLSVKKCPFPLKVPPS
jgi:hypothetical protein